MVGHATRPQRQTVYGSDLKVVASLLTGVGKWVLIDGTSRGYIPPDDDAQDGAAGDGADDDEHSDHTEGEGGESEEDEESEEEEGEYSEASDSAPEVEQAGRPAGSGGGRARASCVAPAGATSLWRAATSWRDPERSERIAAATAKRAQSPEGVRAAREAAVRRGRSPSPE